MTVHMRVLGVVGKEQLGAVEWLRAYDPEANNGRGRITLTQNRAEAMAFESAAAAFTVYRAVPKHHPVRSTDGRPNRPLTAFSIEIVAADVEPL